MTSEEGSEPVDGKSFEDDLRTHRRFLTNPKERPLLPQPLQLPYATEVTLELPLEAIPDSGAPCMARAQLLERHPSRSVDVVGYREVRCGRTGGHEGDHIAVLQRPLLPKRRVRAAIWSS